MQEASFEETPLKMKVSFTEPSKPSLQMQLPELALTPEGQGGPPHCQQTLFYAPFEPTLHFPPNRGCVPDPESIHPLCSLSNSQCAKTYPQTPLAAGEEERHSGEQFPSPSSSAASPKVGAVYWHFLIMLMTHKPWWQRGCATAEGTVHHGDGPSHHQRQEVPPAPESLSLALHLS